MTNIAFKARRLYTWDGQDVDTENYEVALIPAPNAPIAARQSERSSTDALQLSIGKHDERRTARSDGASPR